MSVVGGWPRVGDLDFFAGGNQQQVADDGGTLDLDGELILEVAARKIDFFTLHEEAALDGLERGVPRENHESLFWNGSV